LPSCRNLRYSARLKKLNINSLEIRRLHCDLIYTYKIIFGLVDTDTSVFFNLRNSESRTRGHNYKLYVPQSRLDIHKYFFSHRTLQCWNSLPATSCDFSSLSAFKRLLYACDLSRFTIGGIWCSSLAPVCKLMLCTGLCMSTCHFMWFFQSICF